jgi:two-component system CAI-1 autoinducer sensor kinase/phosphatase CqsS
MHPNFRKRSGDSASSYITKAVSEPLLEPILHPSRWRIRALGLSTAIGHPIFCFIWSSWIPQPYERVWQRLGASLLGILLLTMPSLQAHPPGRAATLALSTIFWLTLPVYFTWMYLCNERNAVWFATMSAMFLIYYHLTDWRIATVGLASGIPAGWALFQMAGPVVSPASLEDLIPHIVVFTFAWYMGLMLGISSSNLRREQLKQALGTMGIMAHELRTPLSTVSLIGDALRGQARQSTPDTPGEIGHLTNRLHAIVRHMNRQIDMQIANAQLMHLPPARDTVDAAQVVREAVQGFPYRDSRERDCVQIQVTRDFSFRSCGSLFLQVIDNLLKNALRSLASMPDCPQPGDLRVEIDVDPARPRTGRISVTDRGQGIHPVLQARLFQPFVSTHQGTGHGLGLAFCQRVVHASGGMIRVESAPGRGARFVIELPVV